MHFRTTPQHPITATFKAELQAFRASSPTILHQAIDLRLEAISKAEAATG